MSCLSTVVPCFRAGLVFVAMGATLRAGPDVRPWSLAPVTDPPAPVVVEAEWPLTSVDPFILARIEARGLRPSPPAEKRTLLRRVTFDLTGLPPTPEEIEAFLADTAPDAYEKVVERLLASPRYGEHWGRHWLDVVRYADTAGDTADYPLPEAWKYRDYVIDSFNADKPYDEFIREQVAGDLLAKEGPPEKYAERVTATGYLALSRRFGFDSENYQHLTIQDTIDTLGQSVLGLTLGCARCHDHKFDPVSMRDYYALFGVFESTRYAFPGSEQKARFRAMAPLVPTEESEERWTKMQSGFAALGMTPGAVLRSLDDLDGDFEMQHVASGGSNGVLVPPWFYEGRVSVSQGAQSPFKNLHPFGVAGVHVSPEAGPYAIRQTRHFTRNPERVHVNLDFRVAADNPSLRGRHCFTVGPQRGAPAVEVDLASDSVTLSPFDAPLVISLPKPGQWQNLRLVLDVGKRTFSGTVGEPGAVTAFADRALGAEWSGGVDSVALSSEGDAPGLEIDNIALQETPIAPVATAPVERSAMETELVALKAELAELSAYDGDLEMQTDGQPPATPWHPGPNSVVKIVASSQSPYHNIYPLGRFGIRLPNSGDYNGLGLNLPEPWTVEETDKLHAGFDFCCADEAAGGEGTWRFHLGHGPASAAVELGFNGRAFFRRSGEDRAEVAALRSGEWYQVRLELDLKARTYTGTVGTPTGATEFGGDFATGWDGTISYAFIDSGGHLNGVKPALDGDNFVIGTEALPPLGALAAQLAGDARAAKLAKIIDLRARVEGLTAERAKRQAELNAELSTGPVPLAYAVSEGTPHDARLQLRGEPDNPGDEVPRGYPAALGGGVLPPDVPGSGRRELAEWLTSPENPLTARVMVNRVWQYHFGRGLVATPNDFGNRSEPPTHPELLDHLAMEFIRSGWSIKAMHRLIVLSATWRQAAVAGGAADGYAGFPRRRLGGEEIRDSILAVSGALDLTPALGHPFPASSTWSYTQHGPFTAVYEHDRRSVYLMVQRIKRHPFLALFDGADPNSSTSQRRITTVPTQALYFLNDPFVHAKAAHGAERLLANASDERERIALAMRLAFGRPPTDEESADALEFLAAYRAEATAAGTENPERVALAAYVRTLFGSNEFLHVD